MDPPRASLDRRAPSVYVKQLSEAGGDDDIEPDDLGNRRWTRKVEVTISARNLRWKNLERYLQLEFPDMVVKDTQKTVLNESYIVVLPRRLREEELQDVDLLRGRQTDVDEFLKDLEDEKRAEGGHGGSRQGGGQQSVSDLPVVPEDGHQLSRSGTHQLRFINRGKGRDRS